MNMFYTRLYPLIQNILFSLSIFCMLMFLFTNAIDKIVLLTLSYGFFLQYTIFFFTHKMYMQKQKHETSIKKAKHALLHMQDLISDIEGMYPKELAIGNLIVNSQEFFDSRNGAKFYQLTIRLTPFVGRSYTLDDMYAALPESAQNIQDMDVLFSMYRRVHLRAVMGASGLFLKDLREKHNV